MKHFGYLAAAHKAFPQRGVLPDLLSHQIGEDVGNETGLDQLGKAIGGVDHRAHEQRRQRHHVDQLLQHNGHHLLFEYGAKIQAVLGRLGNLTGDDMYTLVTYVC